ncbi:MAG: hypothetical protein ACQCN5_12545 [Candidatus Bathyarchaeia archaeon]|jgi:hypothetical protein
MNKRIKSIFFSVTLVFLTFLLTSTIVQAKQNTDTISFKVNSPTPETTATPSPSASPSQTETINSTPTPTEIETPTVSEDQIENTPFLSQTVLIILACGIAAVILVLLITVRLKKAD